MTDTRPLDLGVASIATAACPVCRTGARPIFYQLPSLPVQSNLLMPDRRQALESERGELSLATCPACGFVENTAFDPATQEHSSRYEITQGFSASFGAFMSKLAQGLIERHGVSGKRVVEIGCGSGEFLAALCSLGDNEGIGIDPIVEPDRLPDEVKGRIELRREYFSPEHAALDPDLIVCRHTLEHIADPRAFVRSVRAAVSTGTLAFFEVPDVTRILEGGGFWDIYYEHCGYFTPAALRWLFEAEGFELLEESLLFGDQYLVITARAIEQDAPPPPPDAGFDLEACVATLERTTSAWRRRIDELHASGRKVALWGAGSKACGFLVTLGLADEIDCVVDINPYKQGMHSPGTGHPIVAPQALVERRPDAIIVMNPQYVPEISRQLEGLGLGNTDVLPVE